MGLVWRIFSKAVFNKEKGYAVGFVRQAMFKELKLGDSPTEGIVNQLLAVNGVKISALITETPEKDLKVRPKICYCLKRTKKKVSNNT